MYKFTNGIVVYDEDTRDRYINAGMKLVSEEKKINEKSSPNESEQEEFRKPIERNSKTSTKPRK